jgi:hypothetical protein
VNAGQAIAPWINEPETQKSRLAENPGGRWTAPRYRTASYTRALSDSRRTLVNATAVLVVRVDMNPRTTRACPLPSCRPVLAETRLW